MIFIAYLRDKLLLLMLHISCMMLLAAFLHVTNYPAVNCSIILTVWIIIFLTWFVTEYFRRRHYFRQMEEILEQADQKFLLGELMPQSFRLEDNLYRNMIQKSNKSVIEKIHAVEDARQDYREYIESWVHEIKAPIANITLLCEKMRNTPGKFLPAEATDNDHGSCTPTDPFDNDCNRPLTLKTCDNNNAGSLPTEVPDSGKGCPLPAEISDSNNCCPKPAKIHDNCIFSLTAKNCGNSDNCCALPAENDSAENSRRILQENQKIENYVDMALFYARSDEVYKDYLIKETSLQKTAEEILQKNKYHFIQCGIQAQVNCPDTVYTDTKWIAFILNQLILNAVKYRRETAPEINIFTKKRRKNVCLTIADNGLGIPAEELPRIFDKGFTGTNGRIRGRSTGMGLYLCRKLCAKLGIQMHAQSEAGIGTKILLEFPVSSYFVRS